MPIPEYVLELRRHVGHQRLWLPGVTAVVVRDDEILLVQRADNGSWAPVTGIVDPGEHPAVAARREVLEEAGVQVRVDRLAQVGVTDLIVHANGDHAVYLDHTFRCTWVSGEAYVADDESTAVGWFRRDDLPELRPELLARIDGALADEVATRFHG